MKTILILIALAISCSLAGAAHPNDRYAPKINERCAAKWGDNFRMQKYCRAEEHKGLRATQQYIVKNGADTPEKRNSPQGKIAFNCFVKWTDQYGQHWRMVAYCIEKQDAAYRSL